MIDPGTYDDVPDHVYHHGAEWRDIFSHSAAIKLLRSPATYRESLLQPPAQTDSMRLGSAVHAMVLQPDRFDSMFVRQPDHITARRGKDWTEFVGAEEADLDRTILTGDEWSKASRMSNSVLSHPDCGPLLTGGRHELSVVWDDVSTGVRCKARLDVLGDGYVCDLKTTRDANPRWFHRDVSRYRYHLQAAWYLTAAEYAARAEVERFMLACVESVPPHLAVAYQIGQGSIEAGRVLMRAALERYALCKAANEWPGYSPGVRVIEISTWDMDGDHAEARENIDVDTGI